jgi:predicted secreted Zn-dependent protease
MKKLLRTWIPAPKRPVRTRIMSLLSVGYAFVGMTIFFSTTFLFADEIHLKEGKILTGKITKEDADEYTIRLGQSMYLRVPKENAVKVVRTEPASSPSTTGYLTRPRPVELNKPVMSTSSASTPSGNNATPVVNNVKAGITTKERSIKGFNISEITVTKLYTVKGATMDDIRRDITDRETGKGIKVDRKREASHAQWQVSNHHERKVIVSTLTVSVPQWKPSGNPSPETIQEWNAYLASLLAFEEGRAKIYTEELNGFAESASHLHLETEINDLFETMKTRAANRVQGYMRRSQNKK